MPSVELTDDEVRLLLKALDESADVIRMSALTDEDEAIADDMDSLGRKLSEV